MDSERLETETETEVELCYIRTGETSKDAEWLDVGPSAFNLASVSTRM